MKTGAMKKEAREAGKIEAGTIEPGTIGPGAMPPEAVAQGAIAPGAVASETIVPAATASGIIAQEAVALEVLTQGTVAPEAIDTIELIKRLGYPLHSDAIQRTKDQQTHKGYNTDGYGYQFCTDRFNEVLGIDWSFDWEIIHEEKITTSNGKTCYEITVKMGIWIVKKDTVRCCVGGHISKSYSDALKGAITNAFKKTAAFWGVGRHAYNGALDDDNDPWPEFVSQQPAPPTKQVESPKQPDPAPKQPDPAPKQPDPAPRPTDQAAKQPNPPAKQPASTAPKNNGNGHESSHQNGHTPPAQPAGNGKEAGLRRRIIAKLETIFGRSEEMINAWLDRNFGLKGVEGLSNLHADILEKILDKVEEKFKDWKNSKNN